MLEKMDDFFAARVAGYDEHMRTNIEGASGFYAYTASLLPSKSGPVTQPRENSCARVTASVPRTCVQRAAR